LQEGKFKEAAEIYDGFLPLSGLDIHPKLVAYINWQKTPLWQVGSEMFGA